MNSIEYAFKAIELSEYVKELEASLLPITIMACLIGFFIGFTCCYAWVRFSVNKAYEEYNDEENND